LRLKLAPELVDAFGAVVHPIIGFKHFFVVLVTSSLMMHHDRFNRAQKTKEYLIGKILILNDLLLISLSMSLMVRLIMVIVVGVVVVGVHTRNNYTFLIIYTLI
jgi:hypothetical protein